MRVVVVIMQERACLVGVAGVEGSGHGERRRGRTRLLPQYSGRLQLLSKLGKGAKPGEAGR